MKKRYSFPIALYILVLALAFVSLMAGGRKSDGFFDFSGLATAFGIGIALTGTLLFGLYMVLVYSYGRGRRAFLITLSVMAGILLIAAGAGTAKWKMAQQEQLDFSSAIVLGSGIEHTEPDHSLSLVQETKYKFLPQRDGEVTIELTPFGWDDRINDLSVYDSRKKRILKRHGTVPSQVKLSDAASGEWIYITVQTLTAYDVYRIIIRQ